MNLFFDIPKVHQVGLLTEWLRPMDVGLLDTAVMCHKHRKELVDLLRSPECVMGYLEFMWEGTMEWVIARDVKFSSIHISNRFLSDGEAVEKVMKIIGPSLKSLDYNCQIYDENDLEDDESVDPVPISMDQILYYFVRYLTNLESLRLNGGTVDGMVSVLISSNRSTLKSFELSECSNVSASVLKACCDSRSLEEVTFVTCEFTEDALRFSANKNTTCRKLKFCGTLYSEQIASFVHIFSHLRYVEVHVEGEALVTISQSCSMIEHARIILLTFLTLPLATMIAQNWRDIVQLRIVRADPGIPVCDQSTTLLLINKCLKLQQLTLAYPLETTRFQPIVCPANKSRVTKSSLIELTVNQLSRRTLEAVLKKCPELQSLCIDRPVSTILGSQSHEHAEGSLMLLHHTKVTHLYLSNCMDFSATHLAQLHNIEKLVLHKMGDETDTETIDGLALVALAQRAPRLHTLHLRGCSNIHHSTVLPLLYAAPCLIDFEYSGSTADMLPHPTASEFVLEQAMYSLFPRFVRFVMRS